MSFSLCKEAQGLGSLSSRVMQKQLSIALDPDLRPAFPPPPNPAPHFESLLAGPGHASGGSSHHMPCDCTWDQYLLLCSFIGTQLQSASRFQPHVGRICNSCLLSQFQWGFGDKPLRLCGVVYSVHQGL